MNHTNLAWRQAASGDDLPLLLFPKQSPQLLRPWQRAGLLPDVSSAEDGCHPLSPQLKKVMEIIEQEKIAALGRERGVSSLLMERLRFRSRSPKHSPSPQPGVGDQAGQLSVASLESLDAMSEGDAPTAFTRGSRSRASLPVVRSTNQTKDRSLGVLYLQYGDETKQIRMPNEITSTDTIRALFVSAFPQQLSMKMLESPSVAVYIKDDVRNMYYELSDVRNITDHSFLKVYHKDPAHAFSHNARPTNGDGRMHREMLYSGREGQHTLRQQPMGPPPAHAMQGSLSPTTAHSMPPSPSRIPFGPRPVAMPGSATIPRDRLSSVPPNRSVSPCPSAILERRDVKPDEDMGNKAVALLRNEGMYADPYLMHEGRLSIASTHSGHPADVPDHGMGPGGFHRASIRSNSSYASSTMSSEGIEHHSLYRQKSRKYGDSQLPTLGSKTPPPSPHRMTEVRLVDIHPVQATHIPPQAVQLERGSPVRQSFRKEGAGPMETATKARSNMASPVIPDLPMGHGDKLLQGHIPPAVSSNDPQTRERMKAMEQQIASLTGLVQHALFKGPSTSGAKEVSSDKMVKRSSPVHTSNSGGASPVPIAKSSAENSPTPPPPTAPLTGPVQVSLVHFRKNVSDLRLQLHQMRQLQAMKKLEDPVQRQRALVEEDRHKYLSMEERVLLEQYVDELKRDSSSATVHRAVTLKDVEEGAVGLRKVGESLAGLKGEFPALQTKMRAVLRVEVEAVKFLKEEPHKLDSMLKRVKSLTETLSSLRRRATEGLLKGSETPAVPVVKENDINGTVESEPPPNVVPEPPAPDPAPAPALAPTAGPPPASPTALPEPQSSSIRSEVMPASPMVIHHAQSAPVHMQQSQHSAALVHQPSPPPTPTHAQDRDSPTAVAKGNTPSRGNSPALPKKPVTNPEPPAPVVGSNSSAPQNLLIEEVHISREKSKSRAMSIEAAEKEWEEKRQNIGHYDGKEFDKILQEAQANMMKGIPNLEVASEDEAPTAPPAVLADEVDAPQPPSPPPVAEKPPKPSPDKVAKLSTEKAGKSPPPPPPRRNFPSGSGLTTGRSGEVIFTSRKEPVPAQEGEEEATPQPPKPSKNTELQREEKESHTDENGNDTIRQSPGVIYYVTAQIAKEQPSTAAEDQPERKEATVSPSQVANVNAYEISQRQQQQQLVTDEPVISEHTVAESQTVPPSTEQPVQIAAPESQNEGPKPGGPIQREEVAEPTPVQIIPEERVVVSPTQEVAVLEEHILLSAESVPPPLLPPLAISQEVPGGLETPLEGVGGDFGEQLVLGSSKARVKYVEEYTSLSPDNPGDEGPPPPDNIAFMITDTKVQALSCGEYQEIVNAKGEGGVQTVKVDANREMMAQEDNGFNKKPVIIIFDEPMDIRSAYKRLSTIFECEEELERMLAEERIEEESEEAEEESDSERHSLQVKSRVGEVDRASIVATEKQTCHSLAEGLTKPPGGLTRELSNEPAEDALTEPPTPDDSKQDAKKKFKFKFPKKQLAALTQAIRTGTKTGKKTLQVVVYEEEEEADGTKQQKEAKRFEIGRPNKPGSSNGAPASQRVMTSAQPTLSDSHCRTEEIRKNTYKTLDSLEQTIKQLETTISEMGPRSTEEAALEESKAYSIQVGGPGAKEAVPAEVASSKGVAPHASLSNKGPHRKKSKPQLLPRPAMVPNNNNTNANTTSEQNASVASSASRMPVPVSAKSRQPPGGTEKAGKQQKLQDPQRQFRQANGSAKKTGGENKANSPTLPASKIPAFYPSSAKSSSLSAPNSDSTNPINSSSSSKSSIPCPTHPAPSRSSPASSHIPSLSNGSLKPPSSTHTGKGQHLSFSPQTQNGRTSSSSSSSSYSPSPLSPLSPTSLGQGAKSIRTIHTPSFTSYKPHNGNGSKSTIPSAPSSKDTA
ncbi:hypothetical protein JZ751_004052 [Albula glossodonta]|uniref:Actin interacting protein 3-like C-terminal domain-containing protein n=1 Tax=Albula glossodonta TaxID=121402 RepID=A0A8T2PEG9_9TELE|nr:hypothetical protein JZ751_004052 [Albula glossodonta]